jgi:hypothetical protein
MKLGPSCFESFPSLEPIYVFMGVRKRAESWNMWHFPSEPLFLQWESRDVRNMPLVEQVDNVTAALLQTAEEYDKWNIMGRNGCRISNDKKHRK